MYYMSICINASTDRVRGWWTVLSMQGNSLKAFGSTMEKSTTSINQCFYSLLESKDIQGAVTERSPPFSPSASSICCTYKLRTGCQSWHNFVKTIKHPWCSEISEIATGILRKCTTKVSPRLKPPSQLCRSKLLLHRLVLCPIFPSVPKKPAELGDRQLEHFGTLIHEPSIL